MKYAIGHSSKAEIPECVTEATRNLTHPKLIIFISEVSKFEAYSKELNQRYRDCIIMGTTSYLSMSKAGVSKKDLLVLGIEEGIECYGDVITEIGQYPIKSYKRIEQCMNHFSNTKNCVCFELTAAFHCGEESVLSTLNSVLRKKEIPVFGGSAGDDCKIGTTMVSIGGKCYSDATVFVIIKNLGGAIHLYRENIYKPTEKQFIATKVDPEQRIVYEYDHKPAAKVIAEALGTDVKGLEQYLGTCPMGRVIGDELFITANNCITKEAGIMYHARVYNNAQMTLMETDNYRAVIDETLHKIKVEVPKPALTIVVHCLARSILFETDGYLNEFAGKLGASLGDFFAFSGYGEQLKHENFNQTMVVAVFE